MKAFVEPPKGRAKIVALKFRCDRVTPQVGLLAFRVRLNNFVWRRNRPC
ncbi:MAG: hypothetical protein RMK89_01360 [Armatimonadota bacterium]|nr:hypothetical protein [Armatimonadota bacterium]MDW8142086.1 hypothetical protein [Armatimonadota bacterium]